MAEAAGNVVLIMSHILLFPSIYVGLKYRLLFLAPHAFLTFCVSTSYHVCRAYGTCIMNMSLKLATQLDYSMAMAYIPLLGIYTIIEYGALHPRFLKRLEAPWTLQVLREVYWVSAVWVVLLVGNVAASFLLSENTVVQVAFVAGITVSGLTFLTSIVTTRAQPIFTRADAWLLASSIVLLGIGIAFFPYDGDYYVWFHTLWHLFVFVAPVLFIAAFSLNAYRGARGVRSQSPPPPLQTPAPVKVQVQMEQPRIVQQMSPLPAQHQTDLSGPTNVLVQRFARIFEQYEL
jgi:predicted membrane channel-forming protein YqfA (hemolysin III family)